MPDEEECPDGSLPVEGVCPDEPDLCPDGSLPVEGVCPDEPDLCPDGSTPIEGVCPSSICINAAGHILPVTSQACDRGQGYKICSLVDASVNSATCPPVGIECGDGGTLSEDGKSCVEEGETCTPGTLHCQPGTGNSCESLLVVTGTGNNKTCEPAPPTCEAGKLNCPAIKDGNDYTCDDGLEPGPKPDHLCLIPMG